MTLRAYAACVATVAVGILYGCNRHPPQVAVVPAWPTEQHCWWAVYRTKLPLDSVTDRFTSAFSSLGLAPTTQIRVADTVWISAGLSKLAGYDASVAARMVGYRAKDSTHFRLFVATEASPISLCQQIFRAAPVGAVALREPDGEEKLSVWRRR